MSKDRRVSLAAAQIVPLLNDGGITLNQIFEDNTSTTVRKTKIICTLGPACWSVDGLTELIDAGMNVARFNFSHGDHEAHGECLARLREAIANRPGCNVAVLLDTKGPEIRTGFFANGAKKIDLVQGQDLYLTTDYSFKGDSTKLAVSYPDLHTTVEVGSSMLAADGSLVMTVKEIKEDGVIATVENTCSIGERKNMNLPGAVVTLPTLTEKDISDLVDFAVPQGVDFIAASFVRKAKDVQQIREILGDAGKHIKIISKIENQEGLENYDEILAESDGIMVARGDLGMEIPPQKVFLAQKMMISKANIIGKPVITATQMLESMITNPRPTRAECTDVANAVLDGTDCVMLSGETANGSFPKAAVTIMAKTAMEAEGAMNFLKISSSVRNSVLENFGFMDATESVASSAVKTAFDVDAKMIVVLTETGSTAQMIAKYRPSMPMLVLTAMEEVARQTQGVIKSAQCKVIGSMIGTETILFRAIDMGIEKGWVKKGDAVVCVHGMQEAHSGATNMLRVLIA